MSANSTIDRVRELVDPIVADLKLDLYDLEFRGGTLRVTIDTPPNSPGGVDLEQIALVTRLVSRELDHHDPVPGHYTLEVTSPGLERTLRLPAHFQRELGKTISVRLRDTGNADRRFQGVLQRADDQGCTVLLDLPAADGSIERTVAYAQIDRAKTVFVWETTSKADAKAPGKAARKNPTTSPTESDSDSNVKEEELDEQS